jgi:site-specific recombinase XerC
MGETPRRGDSPAGADRGAEKRRRLGDPEIRRWYDNLARGSPITADHYLRSMYVFAQKNKIEPKALPKMAEARLHRALLDFVGAEERRGLAGSSVATYVKAVKSWLEFHGRRVDRPVRIKDATKTPTLSNERVPTQEELRRVLAIATPQQQAGISFLAFSGLRPEAVGNYLGTDGLRVGDLPDLKVAGSKVAFERTPAMVVVRSELSKAGHQYFSFLADDGCARVAEYLSQRAARGERIGPGTDVVHPKTAPKAFLRTVNVSDLVKAPILRARFDWRPYVLRAYFDTQLLLAESKGKVAHDYRVFWMGHKGTIESRYTVNKGRLTAGLIDDMRESYARCAPFLSTIAAASTDASGDRILRALLLASGRTEEEVKKLDLASMDDGQIADLVRNETGRNAVGPRQQVIDESQLPRYLTDGWRFVSTVNGSKAVVERSG